MSCLSLFASILASCCCRSAVGLAMAWFELCVLRLVFLDSSLQSPGQVEHFGMLFIPLCVVVCEIQLSVQRDNG